MILRTCEIYPLPKAPSTKAIDGQLGAAYFGMAKTIGD